ncbi:MAG: hypothetical protein ACPGU5_06565 [Lishizhenia sp.]
MKVIFLVVLILLFACSELKQSKFEKDEIIGSWRFIEMENISTTESFEKRMNDTIIGFLQFFGPEQFKNAIGKTIEFKDFSQIETKWFNAQILEKVHFQYEILNKDTLLFSMQDPRDLNKIIEAPIQYSISNQKMIWNVDEILLMELIRN